MSLVALGLAILVAFGLLVLDFWVMRRTEKRIQAEDDAEAATGDAAEADAKAAPTTKGAKEEAQPARAAQPRRRLPGSLRAAALCSSLFGWLNLPATLAPVILVALAMQVQPLGGDGTTAICGIIVAAFSLSASVKAMRISDYLFAGEARYSGSLKQSTIYVLGWAVMVLCLLLVGRAPTGRVALVVYSYVGVLVVFAGFLFAIQRSARAWLAAESDVPTSVDPSTF